MVKTPLSNPPPLSLSLKQQGAEEEEEGEVCSKANNCKLILIYILLLYRSKNIVTGKKEKGDKLLRNFVHAVDGDIPKLSPLK